MTTIQKTLLTATLTLSVGIGIYEARLASRLQQQTVALSIQLDSLLEQNQQLQLERDQAVNSLATAQEGTGRSREDLSNLLKLRAEVKKLRGDSRELAQLNAAAASKRNDPTEAEMKSWMERVDTLKAKLGQMPGQRIPEFQFLTDQDWLDAVRNMRQLTTDGDFGQAFAALRTSAKNEFATSLQNALRNYSQAVNGQSPTDLSQLKPYFASSLDDSVFQRYEFTQPGMVTEIATPTDGPDEKYYQISMNSMNSWSADENTLQQAVQSFSSANNGQNPTDPAQLLPYVKTLAEQAAPKADPEPRRPLIRRNMMLWCGFESPRRADFLVRHSCPQQLRKLQNDCPDALRAPPKGYDLRHGRTHNRTAPPGA